MSQTSLFVSNTKAFAAPSRPAAPDPQFATLSPEENTPYLLDSSRSDFASQQKLLVFPQKLAEFENGEDVGFMMIQIYDRNSAKKLSGDRKFAVSVQGDGTATGSADLSLTSNPRAFKSGKNVLDKTNDEFVANKIKEAGAEEETFLVDKDVSLLDRVVVIPMPNQISHSLDASINAKSGAALDAAMSNPAGAAAAALQKVGPEFLGSELRKAFGGDLKKQSPTQKAILAGADSLKGKPTEALEAAIRQSGYVTNDRREMWFEGMEFRTFNFSYTFAPRSTTEMAVLKEIINTLRFYMLPTYEAEGTIAGKFFLLQPAEFEIKFMLGARENKSIPKIDRCLLKNCTVNYSPRDKWVILNGGDGFPPEVTISLSFIEKQLMFREKVFREKGNDLLGGF